MKRIISLFICILLFIGCAFAENFDLEDMDFDTLKALKEAVDLEYFSRPESKGISLAPGVYTVGIDIKPGRYFIKVVEPSSSNYTTRIHLYKDQATFDSRPSGYYGESIYDEYMSFEYDQKSISLEEGNIIYINNGPILFSISSINPDDYYVYKTPDGTYVPAGVYKVGEDIPVGKYNIYAGTILGGEIKLYFNEETYKSDGSWHLGYDKHIEIDVKPTPGYETVSLEDGYIVFVVKDVVMKKQPKLSFD